LKQIVRHSDFLGLFRIPQPDEHRSERVLSNFEKSLMRGLNLKSVRQLDARESSNKKKRGSATLFTGLYVSGLLEL